MATLGVYLSNGDGTRWTLTLSYNATTGQPVALTANNTKAIAVTAQLLLTITLTGTIESKMYAVPPGTTAPNATALVSALKALGLTNVVTQLKGLGGVSV